MKQWTGKANWTGEQILRVTDENEELNIPYNDCAMQSSELPELSDAVYGAYLITSKCVPEMSGQRFPPQQEHRICVLPEGCLLQPGQFIHIAADGQSATINLLQTADLPDRTLFLTGKCNSNCIICPYTTKWRERAKNTPIQTLLRYIKLMDPFAPYLCITGGEPTLLAKDYFLLLHYFKSYFTGTVIHILTNGRAFCYPDFLKEHITARPHRTLLGIPLYAHTSELHDEITDVPGSYNETIEGLDRLYAAGEHIELRIVLTGLNLSYLPNLAKLICKRFSHVYMVSLMGMEMMGNAYINRARTWAPYEEITPILAETVDILVNGGVQTQIYNIPLCKVIRHHWPLCRKSISANKISFPTECEVCVMRSECGGYFITNLLVPGVGVTPIEE
jgi:His-Xaa-Ser system radical SAM maturase HxsC